MAERPRGIYIPPMSLTAPTLLLALLAAGLLLAAATCGLLGGDVSFSMTDAADSSIPVKSCSSAQSLKRSCKEATWFSTQLAEGV